ncbi:MAG: sugar ABC transporter ATP-binding protein [Bryobacterales bacterium]|nr:sugar ABC transporter ATP-binding protein [Bryobacterales bacterium]
MLLHLGGIQKRFGGVTALKNGSLSVRQGEVHLLLGENGAGKSTLMKIVAGLIAPDGGTFEWRGSPVRFRAPVEAAAHGIAMVHQESLLAPHLTIAENLFLGREEVCRAGLLKRSRMRERAAALIAQHKFPLQADWRVEKLTPAGKQLVEICRAVVSGSSLMIFDEPTSSLSESETREVFRIVRELRERGMAVIYITHRLEELRAVGDRVTILRDGETVHTAPLGEITNDEIIRQMVGREMSALYHREPAKVGEELLRVERISRKPLVKEVSLTLRAGEITGLAGLVGAGRSEFCRAVFGVDHADSGQVYIAGKPVEINSPRQAVQAGLALIPEDRQHYGLATLRPVGENISLASLPLVSTFGFLNQRAERRIIDTYMARLRIRAGSPKQLAGRLSGGNQQKAVIAKWVARRARVFLFDEPTRGIDVGAKAEVFQVMDELARSGAAILMVSSEIPELLQMADRILVMRQGRISGELPGRTTPEQIMRLAALETTTSEFAS